MNNKLNTKKVKYPAEVVAHWPSGPVNCCTKHANALVGFGKAIGCHVAITNLVGEYECANCVNENK